MTEDRHFVQWRQDSVFLDTCAGVGPHPSKRWPWNEFLILRTIRLTAQEYNKCHVTPPSPSVEEAVYYLLQEVGGSVLGGCTTCWGSGGADLTQPRVWAGWEVWVAMCTAAVAEIRSWPTGQAWMSRRQVGTRRWTLTYKNIMDYILKLTTKQDRNVRIT